ncbi:MAG: hypothetical protein MHM6MM_006806 [Cercozoa sp. M6MM]
MPPRGPKKKLPRAPKKALPPPPSLPDTSEAQAAKRRAEEEAERTAAMLRAVANTIHSTLNISPADESDEDEIVVLDDDFGVHESESDNDAGEAPGIPSIPVVPLGAAGNAEDSHSNDDFDSEDEVWVQPSEPSDVESDKESESEQEEEAEATIALIDSGVCHLCHEVISGSRVTIRAATDGELKELMWHPGCIRCTRCAQTLEGDSRKFHGQKKQFFCPSCWNDLFALPNCKVCDGPIKSRYVNFRDHKIHADCLACKICAKKLVGCPLYPGKTKDFLVFCDDHKQRSLEF